MEQGAASGIVEDRFGVRVGRAVKGTDVAEEGLALAGVRGTQGLEAAADCGVGVVIGGSGERDRAAAVERGIVDAILADADDGAGDLAERGGGVTGLADAP